MRRSYSSEAGIYDRKSMTITHHLTIILLHLPLSYKPQTRQLEEAVMKNQPSNGDTCRSGNPSGSFNGVEQDIAPIAPPAVVRHVEQHRRPFRGLIAASNHRDTFTANEPFNGALSREARSQRSRLLAIACLDEALRITTNIPTQPTSRKSGDNNANE